MIRTPTELFNGTGWNTVNADFTYSHSFPNSVVQHCSASQCGKHLRDPRSVLQSRHESRIPDAKSFLHSYFPHCAKSERASAESSNGKWENVVNYSCHRCQNLNVFRYVLILSLYLGLFSVFLNSIDICSKHLRYVPSTCNLEFSAPGNRTVERKRENKLHVLKMRKQTNLCRSIARSHLIKIDGKRQECRIPRGNTEGGVVFHRVLCIVTGYGMISPRLWSSIYTHCGLYRPR